MYLNLHVAMYSHPQFEAIFNELFLASSSYVIGEGIGQSIGGLFVLFSCHIFLK